MNTLETDLRDLCTQAPHWMQLELQAFWYGLINWTLTCAEDNETPDPKDMTVAELLQHSDSEFNEWPTDWLEPSIQQFTDLHLTYQQQQEFFTTLDRLFQDSVPTDINIFTLLANGDEITTDQWERLYETVAFRAPMEMSKPQQKTRRIRGRRAITPIKRMKAFTRHRNIIVKKE